MKASDYFEKYKERITTQDGVSDLFIEMSKEVGEIAKERKALTDSASRAIVQEINQKWNALCRMFEKEYGRPVLKRNGFLDFWKSKIPNL